MPSAQTISEPSAPKTPTRKKRSRIEVIDVAKCIAIFMVVLGHTATNAELENNTAPLLIKILYSIHMPLFFFLSGLSISLKPLTSWAEWKQFLRKTILTIAIPYLVWALIYSAFSFENTAWILYGSWRALGKASTLTSLWYLSCLFVGRILLQGLLSLLSPYIKDRRPIYLIPALLCMVIGVLLPDIEIGYPWCLNIAFVAAGFMLLGIALRNKVIELGVQKGWHLLLLFAFTAVLYAGLLHLCGDRFVTVMMAKGYYGNPLFALGFALLGGSSVMLLSMILKRMANEWLSFVSLKPLLYLGMHTMGVFLLHKPMLQSIFIPLFSNAFSGGPDMLIRFLAAFASLLVSLFLCRLIEHYIPELVGIFSKDILTGKKS